MKNIIENLERRYQSLEKEKQNRNFFLGLADYVKYIIESLSLNQIVKNSILKERIKDTEKFKKLKEKNEQKFKESKEGKELIEELKKMMILTLPTMKKMNKKIQKEQPDLLNLPLEVIHNPMLTKDIFNAYDKNYKNMTSRDKIKLFSSMKSAIEKNRSSQSHLKYSKEKAHQEYLSSESSIWGSWNKLELVYDLIHQRKKIEQKLEQKTNIKKDILERIKLMLLSGEMDTVLKRRPTLSILREFNDIKNYVKSNIFSQCDFTKNDYIIHLNRVHNYLIEKLSKKENEKTTKKEKLENSLEIFKIQVRDRYIWINKYLLSKPHAVGSNLEFFEYVQAQPVNTKIERKNLPSQFGNLSFREQIKNKGFIKILNELGFKSEILKAFFPKRGKDMLIYKGDKITKKDLEKAGIKIPLFLKELELAHIKNSPE